MLNLILIGGTVSNNYIFVIRRCLTGQDSQHDACNNSNVTVLALYYEYDYLVNSKSVKEKIL